MDDKKYIFAPSNASRMPSSLSTLQIVANILFLLQHSIIASSQFIVRPLEATAVQNFLLLEHLLNPAPSCLGWGKGNRTENLNSKRIQWCAGLGCRVHIYVVCRRKAVWMCKVLWTQFVINRRCEILKPVRNRGKC